MHRQSVDGMRCFGDSFREGRMSMHCARKLFGGELALDRNARFGDHHSNAGTNSVYSKDLIIFCIAHYLDETFIAAQDRRFADSREGKLSDLYTIASLFSQLLGKTDACDLRFTVGAARDVLIIHRVRIFARYMLDCNYPVG